MAIFQSDMIIKTIVELGIRDMRDNPWLIDDMLSDAATNIYLKDKYGQKQIDACKEWLKNNEIEIAMVDRNDRDRYPLVTITLGTSSEKDEMKTLDEQSTESIKLLPKDIGKPIAYIVKPSSLDYDTYSGQVTFETEPKGIENVSAGMILVDPTTGEGYVILDKNSEGLVIEANLSLDADKYAVVPQYQYYTARVGHTFFQETYNIGCHVVGDPQTVLWLHSIVLYALLRYRAGLLEANGFAQSNLSSSDLLPNPNFTGAGGEMAYSRIISLTGQVENTWIKAPRRIIETVRIGGPSLSNGCRGGIKILSNLDSLPILDGDEQPWTTIKDNE